MASGKKSNSNAGKRTLFAIVALVVIALDIWWVASGQGRDIFSPQPTAETKTERKMYVELCGPLSGDMEWGIALRPEVYNFPQGPSSPAFGRFHAIKAPHGSPGIASPMSSRSG